MNETSGKPNPYLGALALLLVALGAYLAGRWSAQEKLRLARGKTDHYRMLAESEQSARRRAEEERDILRTLPHEEPPGDFWDTEKARRIEELLKRKWLEHLDSDLK